MYRDELDDISEEEEDSLGQKAYDIIKTLVPAFLLVLFIRSSIAEPFRIPTGSMVPTLAIGDQILVTKYDYGLRWPLTRIPMTELKVPDRGDVIVFVYPGSDIEVPKSHFVGKKFTADLTNDLPKKLSYWIDLPVPPFTAIDFVKRVVALPGEEVKVENNVLFINGVPQNKTFEKEFTFVNSQCQPYDMEHKVEDLSGHSHDVLTAKSARVPNFPATTVPPGHVFVMGDNRDNSADSRSWGFVPLRNIKGKAKYIWLSLDFCVPSGMLGSARWERMPKKIQ